MEPEKELLLETLETSSPALTSCLEASHCASDSLAEIILDHAMRGGGGELEITCIENVERYISLSPWVLTRVCALPSLDSCPVARLKTSLTALRTLRLPGSHTFLGGFAESRASPIPSLWRAKPPLVDAG